MKHLTLILIVAMAGCAGTPKLTNEQICSSHSPTPADFRLCMAVLLKHEAEKKPLLTRAKDRPGLTLMQQQQLQRIEWEK